MFLGGESGTGILPVSFWMGQAGCLCHYFGTRPVNHADVLVRLVNAMDVEKARRDERAGAGRSRGRTFAEQFHVEAAFFLRLAQRGLLRVLVQFDVPAQRQPLAELAMVDEQNLAIVNDKNRNGKINFFVDVGHLDLRVEIHDLAS